MTRLVILVLSGAWLLQPFFPAVGQTPFASEAQRALEKEASGKGLTLLRPIKMGISGKYELAEFTFDVPADIELVIKAAGDSTCGDLALQVFNSAGEPIGLVGDYVEFMASPQVTLAADQHSTKINASARLELSFDKTNETCIMAVGVYKR